MNQFTTKISGIPCICKVTHYRPYVPDRISGRYEDAEQGCDEEFEFTILDLKGYPATWLKNKITEADRIRLAEEWEVTILEDRYCYDGDD